MGAAVTCRGPPHLIGDSTSSSLPPSTRRKAATQWTTYRTCETGLACCQIYEGAADITVRRSSCLRAGFASSSPLPPAAVHVNDCYGPAPASDALVRLAAAASSRTPVSLGQRRTASPHEFYRYPARFSPEFVAAAIDAFSAPGDLVADYFVGGGTTLVEARLAGRLAVGTDINSMSIFVSRAKTRLYSGRDLVEVEAWAERAVQSLRRPTVPRRNDTAHPELR